MDRADMTHPLTPREKVAAAIIDSGVNIGTSTWPDDIQVDALRLTDAILTALASGSGDHAGLRRLADEAADFGVPAQVDPAVLNALLAENAALREQVKFEKQVAYDENDRWQEAERKLAEAVGVVEWYGENARLARLIHSEGDAGRNALADDGGKRARTFISKEAERG